MAEKAKTLKLERDYKKYLYFIDGQGQVCRKPKVGDGATEVLDAGVKREAGFLYYVDKDGDVSRSPMARRGVKA